MRTIIPITFIILLGLWTWKLLEPRPIPEAIEGELTVDSMFWLAKSLHACAYGFLTVLAAFLPIRRTYFWAVVVTLAMHGIGTEIGQTFIPSRNGCVRDVIIDWTGIGLGLACLWVFIKHPRLSGVQNRSMKSSMNAT
jgi:VanZ family protein